MQKDIFQKESTKTKSESIIAEGRQKLIKFYLRIDFTLNKVIIRLKNPLFRVEKPIFTEMSGKVFTSNTHYPLIKLTEVV